MKAFQICSWGDDEFFLNREDAERRLEEIKNSSFEQNEVERHSSLGEPIEANIYEIEIK